MEAWSEGDDTMARHGNEEASDDKKLSVHIDTCLLYTSDAADE